MNGLGCKALLIEDNCNASLAKMKGEECIRKMRREAVSMTLPVAELAPMAGYTYCMPTRIYVKSLNAPAKNPTGKGGVKKSATSTEDKCK